MSVKSNKFFRNVWRINGVAILLAIGLGALSALISLATIAFTSLFPPTPRVALIANPEQSTTNVEEVLDLTDFAAINGQSILRADLVLSGDRAASSKFYDYSTGKIIRNIAYINSNNGENWWLLADKTFWIAQEYSFIQTSKTEPTTKKTLGALYLLVPNDQSNKNVRLIMADASGRQQSVIKEGPWSVDHFSQESNTVARLLIHSSSERRIISLDLSTLKVLSDQVYTITIPE